MNGALLAFGLMALCFQTSANETRAEALKQKEMPVKWTGHVSRELLIVGWDVSAVTKQFGAPTKTRKADFSQPMSRAAKLPATVDGQWSYPYTDMGRRLIYFSRGRVVLAIEEWSDW